MSAHAGKENTEPDNINVGLIATIAVVGALLVLAIALALTALVRSEQTSHGNLVGSHADLGTVRRLKAEQAEKLAAAPAWVDRTRGQVAVPIDRAMDAVTAEIRKDPSLATAQAAAPAPAVPARVAPPEPADHKVAPSPSSVPPK